jgi:hypothetical protein
VDTPTILDVVENHLEIELGRRQPPRISGPELVALADAVHQFYSNWDLPQPPAPSTLRINAYYLRPNLVLKQLLYYHEAVVYDPLEYALTPDGPLLGRPRRSPKSPAPPIDEAEVVSALETLTALAPLIRSGIIMPVPAQQLLGGTNDHVETAAHELTGEDLDWFWEEVWGSDIPHNRDNEQAMYWARSWAADLACAAATTSQLTAVNDTTYRLVSRTLEVACPQDVSTGLGLLVSPALAAADLPWLSSPDPLTLDKVRMDNDDFEDWRASLRTAIRQVRLLPEDRDFPAQASQVLADELAGATAMLRRNRSRASRRLQDGVVNLTLKAICVGVATSVAGLPAEGALIGVGAGQIATYLTRSLLQRDDPAQPGGGRTAVLAALLNEDS